MTSKKDTNNFDEQLFVTKQELEDLTKSTKRVMETLKHEDCKAKIKDIIDEYDKTKYRSFIYSCFVAIKNIVIFVAGILLEKYLLK